MVENLFIELIFEIILLSTVSLYDKASGDTTMTKRAYSSIYWRLTRYAARDILNVKGAAGKRLAQFVAKNNRTHWTGAVIFFF